jgi:hypothetical protein
MANQWFKFYGGEYLSDPKILQLNASERSCWLTLLCLASQSSSGSIKFLSEAQLLVLSGISDKSADILKKFQELDMIRVCNGIVTVLNWEKRQYSEGYSRVKKFRESKSNARNNDRIEENRIEENREGEIPPKEATKNFFKNCSEKNSEYLKFLEDLIVKTGLDPGLARSEVSNFCSYWLEKNKSGTRAKWELESTFEVQRRLQKWFQNAQKWSKGRTGKSVGESVNNVII